MRNIYIVRHTEAVHHIEKRLGGWYDTPLTEKGKSQAKEIAANLYKEINMAGIPIYASDLKRCAETAAIFSQIFKSPVTLDKDLRELNFGEGGGKLKEWYDAHLVPAPDTDKRLDHRIFDGAESKREAGTRAQSFMNRLLKTIHKNVIIITHGFFTNYLIMAWMKIPVEHMGYCDFHGQSGGVALLNEDDFWKNRNVIYTNRMDFLEH